MRYFSYHSSEIKQFRLKITDCQDTLISWFDRHLNVMVDHEDPFIQGRIANLIMIAIDVLLTSNSRYKPYQPIEDKFVEELLMCVNYIDNNFDIRWLADSGEVSFLLEDIKRCIRFPGKTTGFEMWELSLYRDIVNVVNTGDYRIKMWYEINSRERNDGLSIDNQPQEGFL